ncbi:hypothetical protein GQ53DRAFT_816790 [Thozetella sp. PMI_491]|nr:hypothetical protein GQ53DRAFT_816790 [Thozetella sp. PMI_491]
MAARILLGAALCGKFVLANVEKAIFLGPPTVNVPLQHPTLDDLCIDTLTPSNFSLRTRLEAQFPSEEHQAGKATWLLLDGLTENQRYEVRICWAAIEPTNFVLTTYELPTVWETPELITSLWEYSTSRQPESDGAAPEPRVHKSSQKQGGERESSLLFLQILAAADYYTANVTLMNNVPPVYVDIILDPFLFNVLPRSLIPTGTFILVVAVASYFVARRAVAWVQELAAVSEGEGEGARGQQKKKKQ